MNTTWIAQARSLFHRLGLDRLQKFRRPFNIVINGLMVLLLSYVIYQNQEALPQLARLLSPTLIGMCLLLYLLSLIIQFVIWVDLMGYQRTELGRATEEYISTIFMGMLPGGLWKIFGRMTVYRAPRLTANTILMINLVEPLLLLLANAVVLLSINTLDWMTRLAGFTTLVVLTGIAAVRLSRPLPPFQHADGSDSGSGNDNSNGNVHSLAAFIRWLLWIGGYVVVWLLAGKIIFLVLTHYGIPLTYAQAVSYWCIAGVAGLVLQALPVNALVRDATLVALLVQASISLPVAIIAAFAIRLIMMTSELTIGWTLLGGIWLSRRGTQQATERNAL